MGRYVDAHLTLQAEGVEIAVRVIEVDLDQITADQRLALDLLQVLTNPAPPSTTEALRKALGAMQRPLTEPTPKPTPPPPPPAADAAPARAAGSWPHPKRPARPKGAPVKSSARDRVMDMLTDGPVSGTLEELSSEADCSYGALRQLLTKAVAAGTIHRATDGRVVTLSLPGDTRPAAPIGSAA